MKVLFVGQPYSESSVWSWLQIKALRELGCQVTVFDERLSYLPGLRQMPHRVSCGLKRRLPALRAPDVAAMNCTLLSVTRQTHPDLFLASKAMSVTMDTVRQIGQLGIVTANWFPDNMDRFAWVQAAARVYNYFFHFDSHAVTLLRQEGLRNIYHLPFACDPEVHRQVELTPTERRRLASAVCFIGAYYPEREEVLAQLLDYDLKVWGYKEWARSRLRGVYQGYVDNREGLMKVYSACRATINIHYRYTANGANYRTFEAAACGIFQLVDRRQDVTALFDEGREIVIFDDVADLREKLAYYLAHEDEQSQVAVAAQSRAWREHTFQHRMEYLLNICLRASTAREERQDVIPHIG